MITRRSASPDRRVSLREVAKAAGVSVTTASDTLNGRGRVAAETRTKVLRAAEHLGYRANVHARALRGYRSGVLGLVSSMAEADLADLLGVEFAVDLLAATASTALSRGYSAVMVPPGDGARMLRELGPDGALFFDPVAGNLLVEQLEDSGIPIVSTGRIPDLPREATTWVDADIAGETERVLDLLAERGARRIALVTNPPTRSYTIDTISGYQRWLAAHGGRQRIAWTDGPASEGAGFAASMRLFEEDELPDAVYAPVDRLAAGAMLAARERGLSVPDDLMVAAGCDSKTARSAVPPITALDPKARDTGRRATELLIDRVEGLSNGPVQIVIPATLHERGSTLRRG
jgi:DNA-binding LacI/PurR family transcriptional regulator